MTKILLLRLPSIDEWAKKNSNSITVLVQVEKMKNNVHPFATSSDCKGKRTSNMVDRATKPTAKFLSNVAYFHGNLASAQLSIRTLAIGYSFFTFLPKSSQKKKNSICLAGQRT
jgi:hypothetical protein